MTRGSRNTLKCDWCPREAVYVVALGNLDGDIWDVRLCPPHMMTLDSCRKMITETKTAVPVTHHGEWKYVDDWVTQLL